MNPWQQDKNYIIRTVTMTIIGRVTKVGENELIVEKASWIVDTGRFHNAIMNGDLSEVEPFNPDHEVIIGRGAIVDSTRWTHPLPIEQR